MNFPVKIKRSIRRRRTVSAKLVKGEMIVLAPAKMTEVALNQIVEKLQKRFSSKQAKEEASASQNITLIAKNLARKYFLGLAPFTIEYVANQTAKYGVCYFQKRQIRLNHRLASMPTWVRDYVIIHELAHLLEPNHSKNFWELVNRYPYTERAKGYLLAKGLEEAEADWDS